MLSFAWHYVSSFLKRARDPSGSPIEIIWGTFNPSVVWVIVVDKAFHPAFSIDIILNRIMGSVCKRRPARGRMSSRCCAVIPIGSHIDVASSREGRPALGKYVRLGDVCCLSRCCSKEIRCAECARRTDEVLILDRCAPEVLGGSRRPSYRC